MRIRNFFFQPTKSVLFAGQAYYNAWYLSRGLRKLGWRADVLNWDTSPGSQIYYHGEDVKFANNDSLDVYKHLFFYIAALLKYEVFHFSNAQGISFGFLLSNWFTINFSKNYEIYFLKKLGKKIVYTNNGCLDGVSQTSFSQWGPESVCDICIWKNNFNVCNDEKNLMWGNFRNQIADYQCLFGGNRADYNDYSSVHEAPEFYCLNGEIWNPDLKVPNHLKFHKKNKQAVLLYHAVGNKMQRTNNDGVNIKSTHVYLPLIEKLKTEGIEIELMSPEGIPNQEVKFLQVQADIFLDMLSYGWYGATVREGMMLGKPVICYIRPEWLECLRQEIPECAAELPIISATPQTVEAILRDLLNDPKRRHEIGRQSREFCLKWHSDTVAAKRFDVIYSKLLKGESLLSNIYRTDINCESESL